MKTKLHTLIWLGILNIAGSCQQPVVKSADTQIQPVNLRTICRLPDVLIESSGVAIEGRNRIWSHEDSGNSNKIYCIDTTGALLRTVTISNVENIDWEDMAVDNEETWYICDAGNNNNDRDDLAVYRIPSPDTFTGNEISAGIIRFSFSDQTSFPPPSSNRNYDIEAMVWHNDSLFLFTKDRSSPFTGYTKMYVLPDTPGTYIARLVDSYYAGNTPDNGRITSADINHHTGELMLLTHKGLISFSNYPGNRFFDGEVIEYNFTSTPGQNEGIGFVSSGKLYMTEEGTGIRGGYLYEILLPEPLSVENKKQESYLKIFPNQANDQLLVTCLLNADFNLEIRDLTGALLKLQPFRNNGTIQIDELPKGIYVVSLVTETMKVSRKIILL